MDPGGLVDCLLVSTWVLIVVCPMNGTMFLERVKIRPPAGGLGGASELARESGPLAFAEFESFVCLEAHMRSRLGSPWQGGECC
jgi:hypothetical protein